MRKSAYLTFIKKMLKEICNGYGFQKCKNPAIAFSLRVKSGVYDKLTDDDYATLLTETEIQSELWQGQPSAPTSDIFIKYIESLKPDSKCIDAIAELLCSYYEKTYGNFLPELEHPELIKGIPKDFNSKRDYSPFVNLKSSASRNSSNKNLSDPQMIYEYLTDHIHGQKDACRAAAMLLYNHARGQRRNILFVGPTGCGKTQIWNVCRHLYPYIIFVQSDRITAEGWSGSFKVHDIFTGMTRDEIEQSIVVFDEFDKMCEPQFGRGNTNYSHVTQNNLLKLIEGGTITTPSDTGKTPVKYDSSKISFVFLGSFEHLTEMKTEKEDDTSIGFGASMEKKVADDVYTQQILPDDLIKYTEIRREIVGRINQIVQLSPMTSTDYEAILNDKIISPIHNLEQDYGITIHMSKETRKMLAKEAADTHMGVRYLQSRVQSMLDDCMFQDCSKSEYVLDVQHSNERSKAP